jgi:hypothetical protein
VVTGADRVNGNDVAGRVAAINVDRSDDQ